MEVDHPGDEERASAGIPSSQSGLKFQLHARVLFRISDHHTRGRMAVQSSGGSPSVLDSGVGSASGCRVVGCLLGQQQGRVVDISNCFELVVKTMDDHMQLDLDLLKRKLELYREVHPGIDVLGWYMTGEDVCGDDSSVALQTSFLEMNPASVVLVCNLTPKINMNDIDIERALMLYETEEHTVDGQQNMVFTMATFDIVSTDMERIVMNQFRDLTTSDSRDKSITLLQSHQMGLHGAVQALIERVVQLQKILIGMKNGDIPYDAEMAMAISSFIGRIPLYGSKEYSDNNRRNDLDVAAKQKESLLTALMASTMSGSASLEQHSSFDVLTLQSRRR